MGKNIRQQHEDQKNAEHERNERDDGERPFLEFEMHEVHRHQGRFPHREGNQQNGEQHFRQPQVNDGDLDDRQDQEYPEDLDVVGCWNELSVVMSYSFEFVATAGRRR